MATLGLDPDYVRRLLYVVPDTDDEHPLELWSSPLVFCVEGGVDPGIVAQVLAEVRRVTGLPGSMSDAGCNVRWTGLSGKGHQATGRSVAGGHDIIAAQVFVYRDSPFGMMEALHEAGHVIGLGHSPRTGDLMYPGPRADHFSGDELAVLARMYGR